MANILRNYIKSKGQSLIKLSGISGISTATLSKGQNSSKGSIDLTVRLAYSLKDTKVSIKGIENGKEVFLNLEIKY